MATFGGSNPLIDNLVLYYDTSNVEKSFLGQPSTNTIPITTVIGGAGVYNNPGFTTTIATTGEFYKGSPVYRVTFRGTTANLVSRLSSTDGFGFFHNMGTNISASTRYIASIYFKTSEALDQSSTQGFINTYSNISGWGSNNTANSRYTEGEWTRLYTEYFTNTNGYIPRTNTFTTTSAEFTTTGSPQDVIVPYNIASNLITDFGGLYAFVGTGSAAITGSGGTTAQASASILNQGIDTNFTKLSWPSTIKLQSEVPFTYYYLLRINGPPGNYTVNIRPNLLGYYNWVTDQKYWKITFPPSQSVARNTDTVLTTFWTAPMIEQISSSQLPSPFVIGTRSVSGSLLNLVSGSTTNVISASFTNSGSLFFNSSSFITITDPITLSSSSSFSIWANFNRVSDTQYLLGGSTVGFRYSATQQTFLLYNGNNSFTAVSWSRDNNTNNVHVNRSGSSYFVYLNGGLLGTGSTGDSNSITINTIGKRSDGFPFSGSIPVVQMYNTTLTDSQIQQNFNSFRSRFGI